MGERSRSCAWVLATRPKDRANVSIFLNVIILLLLLMGWAFGVQVAEDLLTEEAFHAKTAEHVVLELCGEPMSLNKPFREGEDGCVEDQFRDEKTASPQQHVIDRQISKKMHSILHTLTPREEKMMRSAERIGG